MSAKPRRAKQRFADFTSAEHLLKAGKPISAEDFADLLDHNRGLKVPDLILDRVIQMLRQYGKRGRKPLSAAGLAWTLDRAIYLYDRKLQQLRREDADKKIRARGTRRAAPAAEMPAHERAAIFVLERMKKDLRNISAKTLLNLMSAYNRSKNPSDYMIPPDELDPPDHLPVPPPGSPLIPLDEQVIDVPAKR